MLVYIDAGEQLGLVDDDVQLYRELLQFMFLTAVFLSIWVLVLFMPNTFREAE